MALHMSLLWWIYNGCLFATLSVPMGSPYPIHRLPFTCGNFPVSVNSPQEFTLFIHSYLFDPKSFPDLFDCGGFPGIVNPPLISLDILKSF
jgi:hypothetical protein